MKKLSEFIPTHHFKLEGINAWKGLLKSGEWLTNTDLKGTYFMVPVHSVDREYLQVSALDHHFQFTCFSFGLSCAPWVFNKIPETSNNPAQ